MTTFEFRQFEDITHNRVFGNDDIFAYDGNGNIIIRDIGTKDEPIKSISIFMDEDTARKLVSFYVDAGLGTTKRLGKTGDVGTILVSKDNQYTVSTTQYEVEVPGDEYLYFNKLIRPTRLEVYRHSDEFKMTMTFKDHVEATTLTIEVYNFPDRGVTLPRTVSDAVVEWLSYWFSCEAVERRILGNSGCGRGKGRKRDLECVFSGSGKNYLSDIYITRDKSTLESLLVVTYDNSTRYLVLSMNKDNPHQVEFECLDSKTGHKHHHHKPGLLISMTGDEVLRRLRSLSAEGEFEEEYLFKNKRDVEAFDHLYAKWSELFKTNSLLIL